jgi:fucose permease
MQAKTLPIFLTFFLIGLADAIGPMSDGVKRQYDLSNLVATLLPFFVFIAFALFSLPGGLMAARIGKRNLLLVGLGLNAIALLPLLMGWFLDLGWQAFAFIVPTASFAYLLLLSLQRVEKVSKVLVTGRKN